MKMKSISRKTGMIVAVLALLVAMSAPTAMALSGKLWLETIPPGTEVDYSDDPWLIETTVTSDTSFDLEVYNHNSADIHSLYLLVAVDRVPADNVTVSVNGTVVSPYDGVITTNNKAWVTETDPSHNYSGAGIYKYGSDTHFEVVEITIPDDGILEKYETMSVLVEIAPIASAVKVNFNAIGADADNKAIASVPHSHDVTYQIPEFATIAIPAIALLGLFAFYRRKQKK